jgi:hypothetical protein
MSTESPHYHSITFVTVVSAASDVAGIHHASASYNCGLFLGSNAAILKRPKGVSTDAWLLGTFGHYFGMKQPEPVQPGRAPGFPFFPHCKALFSLIQRHAIASLGSVK